MSSEENRSAGNLLLLCIPHSYEIDDPLRVNLFPKELLKSWKEQQLAEYDKQRNGWSLSDADAEEVIHQSDTAEVIIQGGTINLGAQGGQAPGAGGAGGTAIGRGAISGSGGPGGPISFNLGGLPGAAPGAGGGGESTIDPESELLWRGPGRTPTVGQHEYLGMDGQDGGDTTLSDAEGNVLLRARGGQAALAGSGIRSVSSKFAVSTLLLANSVEITGAYVSLLNGGFAHYNVLNLNDQLLFMGLIVFEGGGTSEGEYAFTIQARAPGFEVAQTATHVFRIVRAGDINRIILQFSMRVLVSAFGAWTIVVLHDGRELAHLPVVIQQGISGKQRHSATEIIVSLMM